jgi:hypothetical protein
LKREACSLTVSGGYLGRWPSVGDSPWIFDVGHSASLVTPDQMEDKDTLDSDQGENDSISSTVCDSKINEGSPSVGMHGNRLINLPSLI